MPLIKVYIHIVWSTKNRTPFLNTLELRQSVWQHIRANAKEKGIFIDFISGYSDHCHYLISLGSNQTLEKILQLIKGESSFWINKNKLTSEKFEWQDEYWAFSVSETNINAVRNYIARQEEKHSKKTFQEEFDEIIEKFDSSSLS